MTPELDKKLCEKYPYIFSQRGMDMSQTAMCWGMQCENGWWNLLDNLCSQLDLIHKKFGIITVATTVKEKYGVCRFYYSNDVDPGREPKDGDKEIYTLIDEVVTEAERVSELTCEVCGKPGSLCEKHRWYQTLCPEHALLEGYSTSAPQKEI